MIDINSYIKALNSTLFPCEIINQKVLFHVGSNKYSFNLPNPNCIRFTVSSNISTKDEQKAFYGYLNNCVKILELKLSLKKESSVGLFSLKKESSVGLFSLTRELTYMSTDSFILSAALISIDRLIFDNKFDENVFKVLND